MKRFSNDGVLMKTTAFAYALLPFFFCTGLMGSEEGKAASLDDIFAPIVVGTPPSDAFTGLIRLPDGEIRHYGGGGFIFSRDDGHSWKNYRFGEEDGEGRVKRGGGAGAVSPRTGAYVRLQGTKSGTFAFRSPDGIDGDPTRTKIDDRRFIMIRPPIFLKSRDRALFAAHTPTRPHRIGVFRSDDDGKTWAVTMLPPGPRFEVKPPHRQPRWENWCVEPTVLELKDGRLWMIARTSQDRHYECFSEDGGRELVVLEAVPLLRNADDAHAVPFERRSHSLLLVQHDAASGGGPFRFVASQNGKRRDVGRRVHESGRFPCGHFRRRGEDVAGVSRDSAQTRFAMRRITGTGRSGIGACIRPRPWKLPGGKVLVAHGQDANVRRPGDFRSRLAA